MPLHLLGKKSWNVYNADNIARVKADEAAAAAREAAKDQRMQELDAERRAAILRGRTPPPLLEEAADQDTASKTARDKDHHGRGRKRKLAGEDDTDMDIRLAKSVVAPRGDDEMDAKVLKLRNTASDAPLMDHAGNIDLFPVDMKEAIKREKNAEVEKEKRKKELALEDQYTMRFSNAAGRSGLAQPWYTAQHKPQEDTVKNRIEAVDEGFANKDVWGNEDPRRKERELSRISTNDPFAFMQKAQAQLKKSKQDKKKWIEERGRELKDLKAVQDEDDRRSRHRKRRREHRNDVDDHRSKYSERDADSSSGHRHHYRSQSQDHSRTTHERASSHRSRRRRSRSESKERARDRRHRHNDGK